MLNKGDNVVLQGSKGTRYGKISWAGDTGVIVSLFENQGSVFLGVSRRYRRGDCINFGLYYCSKI